MDCALKPARLVKHVLGPTCVIHVKPPTYCCSGRYGTPWSNLARGCRHHRAAAIKIRSASFSGENDACASNLGEYCSLGPDAKPKALSLGEKERLYLEAVTAATLGKQELLTHAEYENLKEELTWQGSEVLFLTSGEQQFLAALRMQSDKVKLLSDDKFGALEAKLRLEGSPLATWGPRCSLQSKTVFTDAMEDESLANLLKLPIAALLLGILFGGQVATDAPWGSATDIAAVVAAFTVANFAVGFALRDCLVLRATCPQCENQNWCVLGQSPFLAQGVDAAVVTCQQCGAKLQFEAQARRATIAPNGTDTEAS